MSDETTLLPCPFCGSNKAYPNIKLGKHWVECRECTAESGCYRTEAEAVAAWNTRAHGTLTAEQVREAAKSNSRQYESPVDDGIWIREYDWQAIADELNAKLEEKPRDRTEEWLLNACNQATQDYVTQLDELIRDLLQLRCRQSCADCEHEDDEGCNFMTRALELGIEVY